MSEYRSYRAPSENHSRLCVPELDSLGPSILENRRQFESSSCRWLDIPLTKIRTWAQNDTLQLATDFTRRYWSSESSCESILSGARSPKSASICPLILSGHQPELFHPGVWFKNFLLSSLAKQHSGIGVNILVDHDLSRNFALQVPSITDNGQLTKEQVSIDDEWHGKPWELTWPKDISRWKDFLASIVMKLQTVGNLDPLIVKLWPNVIHALEQGKPVGEVLASARHIFELSNGLQTLELPFSQLASERSFACFAGEILSRIETVHDVYNSARNDYRSHHGIKNHLQPIPELGRDKDWFETPFWIYSATDPMRRPLWVCRKSGQLRLSDRRNWTIDFPETKEFEPWFTQWKKLLDSKFYVRPRALTTTMFLRLAVGDLFIHGIGGGKYDQMTDRIIESLWPICSPKYLVATATLYLPIKMDGRATLNESQPAERDVLQKIRHWRFTPERLLNGVEESTKVHSLLCEKESLLAKIPLRTEKIAWHRELQNLNSRLRQHCQESEESLSHQLRNAIIFDRNQAILASREFSISIFPSTSIVMNLLRLCPPTKVEILNC